MASTKCEAIAQKLSEAFIKKAIITAGINGNLAKNKTEGYSNLLRNHAYGVIGFEPSSGKPEDATITVINPQLSN